jgi:hypothetical protein
MPSTHDKVLYIRNVPPDLANKLKAAAALNGQSLQQYLVLLLRDHVTDLERNGLLPKGKGIRP